MKHAGRVRVHNRYFFIIALGLTVFSCCAGATNRPLALADQLLSQGKIEQAYAIFQELADLNPDNSELKCNQALLLQKMGNLLDALRIYEPLLKNQPNYARALRGASHVYLALGDFNKGWPAYEYRWKNPPDFNKYLKEYLQHGGSLLCKRILLIAEYGLGDTLQFIRYAAELKKERGVCYLFMSKCFGLVIKTYAIYRLCHS